MTPAPKMASDGGSGREGSAVGKASVEDGWGMVAMLNAIASNVCELPGRLVDAVWGSDSGMKAKGGAKAGDVYVIPSTRAEVRRNFLALSIDIAYKLLVTS